MNHQTKDILEAAKLKISLSSCIDDNQADLLMAVIDLIGQAIEKEAECSKGGPCCN